MRDTLAKECSALIAYYGGSLLSASSSSSSDLSTVTHALATACPGVEEMRRLEQSGVQLVTPDWLLACIRAAKLVDTRAYHPRYLLDIEANKRLLDESNERTAAAAAASTTNSANTNAVNTATGDESTALASDILRDVITHIVLDVDMDMNTSIEKLATTTTTTTTITPVAAATKALSPSLSATKAAAAAASATTTPLKTPGKKRGPKKHTPTTTTNNNNVADTATAAAAAAACATLKANQHFASSISGGEATESNGDAAAAAAFTLDMNEIFQTVISSVTTTTTTNSNKESNNVEQQQKQPHEHLHSTTSSRLQHPLANETQATSNDNNNNSNSNDNDVYPFFLRRLMSRPSGGGGQTPPPLLATFDDNNNNNNDDDDDDNSNSLSHDGLNSTQRKQQTSTTTTTTTATANKQYASVQENAHLIQFDCCLLGCVFYMEPSSALYTRDCLADWARVVERFGGTVAHNYTPTSSSSSSSSPSASHVTHVLCPNRFGAAYERAMLDNSDNSSSSSKPRVVTAYWLEDVLHEQRLRPPWLAYHYPSPYESGHAPLANHVLAVHGFVGKQKLVVKTLVWLLGAKYSSCVTPLCTHLICRTDTSATSSSSSSSKLHKVRTDAALAHVRVVNGVWLNELYLGNVRATLPNQTPLAARYTTLGAHVDHMAFDSALVAAFDEQWKTLVRLPLDRLRQHTATGGIYLFSYFLGQLHLVICSIYIFGSSAFRDPRITKRF